MTSLSLSLPSKRVSAWIAETDPKYARAWLASLPHADSAETARELYQALYTLNRQELSVSQRFELMELYHTPIANVTTSLESYYLRAALPLTPKKRQLAEFIRQLHMEMAFGFKACLQELDRRRVRWGKKILRARAMALATHYLGEVLLHSYQVYMPHPVGVWKDLHVIYLHGLETGLAGVRVALVPAIANATTLLDEYIRVLLLGLCNPYQLPQGECRLVQRFLRQWGEKAVIHDRIKIGQAAGYFLVDAENDAPPVSYPNESSFQPDRKLWLLNPIELVRLLHQFIQRLQQGESARDLTLGVECLDTVCLDFLQRLARSWGQPPRRQFSRLPRNSPAFVCAGIPAIHFFVSGQKPFTPPRHESRRENADDRISFPTHLEEEDTSENSDKEEFIALDEPVATESTPSRGVPETPILSAEGYRVDRWQVKDTAPKGLQLMRFGSSHTYVRVGDAVGIQQMDEIGRWNVGVVRWMKSPETGSLEMGLELLASGAQPVAVASSSHKDVEYQPALLLPAIETLHRPATLLLPRGVFAVGSDLLLGEENGAVRVVRLMQRLEYTNVFELLVFADLLAETGG